MLQSICRFIYCRFLADKVFQKVPMNDMCDRQIDWNTFNPVASGVCDFTGYKQGIAMDILRRTVFNRALKVYFFVFTSMIIKQFSLFNK